MAAMNSHPLFGNADLFGFYVPPFLIWAILAVIPYVLLTRLAAWSGFYRLVWHRPLFDAALYLIVLGCLVFGGPALLGDMT